MFKWLSRRKQAQADEVQRTEALVERVDAEAGVRRAAAAQLHAEVEFWRQIERARAQIEQNARGANNGG